jgi:hypothetical protein
MLDDDNFFVSETPKCKTVEPVQVAPPHQIQQP